MRTNAHFGVLVVVGLAAGLGGCGRSGWLGGGGGGGRFEVPVVSAKAPAATGVPAVDVTNSRGSVVIEVDSSLKAPRVSAVTRAGAVPTWIGASMGVDHGRPVLRVLNTDPRALGEFVDIRVLMPACGGVRVRNSEGPVRLSGVGGAVDVETSLTGDARAIDVRMGSAADAPIALRTDRGSVLLVAPTGSKGAVHARAATSGGNGVGGGWGATGGGGARVAAPNERMTDVRTLLGEAFAVVNGGTNPIEALTGAGDVEVRIGR